MKMIINYKFYRLLLMKMRKNVYLAGFTKVMPNMTVMTIA